MKKKEQVSLFYKKRELSGAGLGNHTGTHVELYTLRPINL